MPDKERREQLIKGLEEAHRIEQELDARDRQADEQEVSKLVELLREKRR
jgi:hypothetical protein